MKDGSTKAKQVIAVSALVCAGLVLAIVFGAETIWENLFLRMALVIVLGAATLFMFLFKRKHPELSGVVNPSLVRNILLFAIALVCWKFSNFAPVLTAIVLVLLVFVTNLLVRRRISALRKTSHSHESEKNVPQMPDEN